MTKEEDKENHFMDIDRMVNEGLGGGIVSTAKEKLSSVLPCNGLIEETTTDTMEVEHK